MQRNHHSVVFLHGFLGDPSDWDRVISYLPEFDCKALNYPFTVPEDATLVGYSMGGRIALRYPNPKILLSAHPGLQTTAEKEARWRLDQQWATLLENIDFSLFLKEWYQRPLFDSLRRHPYFSTLLQKRTSQDPSPLAEVLLRESLANQTFLVPENSYFIHGAFDTQFKNLYQRHAIPSHEIPDAGHAAHLENPKAVAEVIRDLMSL